VILAAAVVFSATAARVLREKPPEAHTGGFGEPTCEHCHSGEPLNAPGGVLRIDGLPQSYEANHTYPLTVLLIAHELNVGGFEIAARFSDANQAGHFEVIAPGTIVTTSKAGIEYVSHTLEGVAALRDTVRWSFVWHSPADARRAVSFHAAANASNDDASPLGDHIYTSTVTVSAR